MNKKTFCLDDRFIGKKTSVKSIGKRFDSHMIEIPSVKSSCQLNFAAKQNIPTGEAQQIELLQNEIKKFKIAHSDLNVSLDDLPWILAYNKMAE